MPRTPSLLLIPAFSALMALGAQINVPMVPVPMTMQTFAVLLAGATLGPWRGTASVLLYLAAAAAGLPILSDGTSGLAPFAGPTAGYLFAFPLAAALVGAMFTRDALRGPVRKTGLMILGHILILAMGAGWLASSIGLSDALAYGVTPFLIGMVVKSALVVATAGLIARLRTGSIRL